MKKYHHIVLFHLRDTVDQEGQDAAVASLRALGQNVPGLQEWSINPSIDTRKGRIIIEEAVFTDRESYQEFRTSKEHNQIKSFMTHIADWWVGDYEA